MLQSLLYSLLCFRNDLLAKYFCLLVHFPGMLCRADIICGATQLCLQCIHLLLQIRNLCVLSMDGIAEHLRLLTQLNAIAFVPPTLLE